jgi:hypothetical protein
LGEAWAAIQDMQMKCTIVVKAHAEQKKDDWGIQNVPQGADDLG